MTIDEMERDGWEVIDTFGEDLIVSRGAQRIVVDSQGDIIIVY